jgi:hypothetical protein
VGCHRGGGGLLQRFVGEQPVADVAQLGRRASAQQHRLDQDARTLVEKPSKGGGVGNPRAVGQRIGGDCAQRLDAGRRRQVGDVVERKPQDGLTPVTITL